RQAFRELTRTTQVSLQTVYDDIQLTDEAKRTAKEAAMAAFRNQYAALRERWNGYPGYDAWVRQANNASFGAQAAYDDWVPAFEALFEREDRNFGRFYDAVRNLANQSPDERLQALRNLTPPSTQPP